MREKTYTVNLTKDELVNLILAGGAVLENLVLDEESGRYCETHQDWMYSITPEERGALATGWLKLFELAKEFRSPREGQKEKRVA